MKFLTSGDIAKQLNKDRDTVAYALRKLRIQPIGRAGQVRLFPADAIDQAREFIDSVAKKKVEVQNA
tara:strand:+ start:2340 stop:2540 length:201 start_codon:yes stop_codon:yes gene_type:complete